MLEVGNEDDVGRPPPPATGTGGGPSGSSAGTACSPTSSWLYDSEYRRHHRPHSHPPPNEE